MSRLFTDPDGDTMTFWVSSQYPGIIDVWMKNDQVQLNARNPAASTITYGVSDAYGGYASGTFTATGVQNETRSVMDNVPPDWKVGAPITGNPYAGETLAYKLTGEAASEDFVIATSTGQISVPHGGLFLNHEKKSSYTGQVTWTVQGQTATANLTINVVAAQVGKPDAPTLIRVEFDRELSNPELGVTWTRPEANRLKIIGYNVRYRKKISTSTPWTTYSRSPDPQYTIDYLLPRDAIGVPLKGLEAGAIYQAQVRALTGEKGEGPWSDIGEGRANRPPDKRQPVY